MAPGPSTVPLEDEMIAPVDHGPSGPSASASASLRSRSASPLSTNTAHALTPPSSNSNLFLAPSASHSSQRPSKRPRTLFSLSQEAIHTQFRESSESTLSTPLSRRQRRKLRECCFYHSTSLTSLCIFRARTGQPTGESIPIFQHPVMSHRFPKDMRPINVNVNVTPCESFLSFSPL